MNKPHLTERQYERLVASLPALPTIDWVMGADGKRHLEDGAKKPTTYYVDGTLLISAEEGDGFLDFYGEFRGGYPYIHPELEAWATKHDGFLEWKNPGAACFYRT